jgi:hypothetical protein
MVSCSKNICIHRKIYLLILFMVSSSKMIMVGYPPCYFRQYHLAELGYYLAIFRHRILQLVHIPIGMAAVRIERRCGDGTPPSC